MRNAVSIIAGLVTLLAAPATLNAQPYVDALGVSDSALAEHVNPSPMAVPSANRVVSTESWVEEWDEASQSWIRVEGTRETKLTSDFRATQAQPAGRYYAPAFRPQRDVEAAQYGPFKVIDGKRAALVGATDSASPKYFDMMLADFPAIGVLEIVEGPGTSDDVANLALGRKIRGAGLTTRIGAGGSARSGAVELFLAGENHVIEDGAEFAVHSWRDNFGREPQDYAPNAPENRFYLDYYEEMGMSAQTARAFYDMTNSVPHVSALWLDADDMRPWVSNMGDGAGIIEPAVVRPQATAQAAIVVLTQPAFEPLAEIIPAAPLNIGVIDLTAPKVAYQDVSLLDSGLAFP